MLYKKDKKMTYDKKSSQKEITKIEKKCKSGLCCTISGYTCDECITRYNYPFFSKNELVSDDE